MSLRNSALFLRESWGGLGRGLEGARGWDTLCV